MGGKFLPSLTTSINILTFPELAVGYVVKLSTAPLTEFMSTDADRGLTVHIPVNNILVGGA
jgi:hypothetical protein